jgi:hypothetical protein
MDEGPAKKTTTEPQSQEGEERKKSKGKRKNRDMGSLISSL